MVEQEGVSLNMLGEILTNFPPQEEKTTFINREGKAIEVKYRVSRDPTGLILYAAPEAEWLKRGEQPENQPTV